MTTRRQLLGTVWTSNEAQLKLLNSIADAYQADHPKVGSIWPGWVISPRT